jgi:RNA polymerase sigma-70 factor, ECF subfamily
MKTPVAEQARPASRSRSAAQPALTTNGTPRPRSARGVLVDEARPRTRGRTTTPVHVLDPQTLGDHLDRLFRAAWALCGSRDDAEDLVQETYARVLARPRLLRSDNDLAYLLRVLRNTFISWQRAAALRPRAVDADPEALDLPDIGAADPLVAAQTRQVLDAIGALPAEFRDAVIAVDVAGLSYSEASKVLHLRGGTIASRLFRAREQVAQSLSQSLGSRE